MIYRPKSKFLAISILVGIFIIVYTIFVFAFPNILPSIGTILIKPLDLAISPFLDVKDYVASVTNLKNENEKLRKDLDRIELSIANYQSIVEENIRLKNVFEGEEKEGLFIMGKVILGPLRAGYDRLKISLGNNKQVTKGDMVYASETIIIGQVEEEINGIATVYLFSSPSMETDAVLSRTGAPLSLRGIGGGSFELQAPKDTDIAINDAVVLPGTNTLIAFVESIKEEDDQTLKRIYLITPVNIFAVQEVFVKK